MKLSTRMDGVAESSTLKMNALAKEMAAKGVKVINLTAGEPNFPVPASVKEACIASINANDSKYTAVGGIPELRTAIAEKLSRDNGLKYAADQILVSCGAKHSIFNFLLAAVSPGEEVIVPAPYWVSYPEMVKLAGGVPVILHTDAKSRYKISAEQLKKALTKKTKAVILNSPSNPTGVMYTREEMSALAEVLEGTDAWVLSDEIYEKLSYDGPKFTAFAALSQDAYNRTITVNGFSKAYAMTGWRLGYAAGPKNIIAAMTLIQGQSTSNPTSIVQKAGLKALSLSDQDLKPMVDAFHKRRDRMAEIFARCKSCSFVKPDGAFYYLLNVERLRGAKYNIGEKSGSLLTGEDLAFFLLEHAQVVTVPGEGFGAPNHLRVSFAVSDSDVDEGAKRLVETFDKLASSLT